MMSSPFIIGISGSALLAVIATIWALKKRIGTKQILIASIYISVLLIPIVGLYIGTWHTHGFDIPWWVFGILNAIVMMLVTLSVMCLVKFFYRFAAQGGEFMADIEYRSKARKIANSRNLAAMANDTKWSEFFSKVSAQLIELEVKFINADLPTKESIIWIPSANYIEGHQIGPELFTFIEWVRSRDIENLSLIAANVGLDHVIHENKITVFGYK